MDEAQPDWPAAHSMDTDWFAVDRDGRVALLDTLEAGALPATWKGGQDGASGLNALWRTGHLFDVQDLPVRLPSIVLCQMYDGSWSPAEEVGGTELGSTLLQLAHPRVLELLPGTGRLQTASGWYGWCDRGIGLNQLERLHARGWVLRGWQFHGFPSSRLGVYIYQHDWAYENTQAGPYGRREVPRIPLLASALPPSLRARAVTLPVSFARDERIQPAEHVPCLSHSSWWFDTEGRMHDFD